jgi:hypothetical protein
MAAPVLESFTSATGVGGDADPVLTKPANVATGDLLLIFVGNEDTASSNNTVTPSGFTLLQHVGDGARDCHALVFYRIADGTEASTVTVQLPNNDEGVAWYLRVSGADTTTPFGSDINTTVAVSTNLTLATLTRDDLNKDQLAFSLCSFDGGDSDMGITNTSGWDNYNTDRATSNSALEAAGRYLERRSSGASSSAAWDTQTKTGSGTGPVGSQNWSFRVSDGAVGIAFTVNPGSVDVTVNAVTIACTSTVPAVTVDTSFPATVNATTIATVATTPAVTVATGTGVTVSPTAIVGTVALPVTSIRVNETLLLAVISATTTTPAVTVSTGAGVTVSPAVIATAATTPAVTVFTQTNVAVNPALIAAVVATPAPTITQGTGVTVNAATVATAATTPAVTVNVDDFASPATITATAAVPAVTVTGDATVSAGTIAATSTVPVPEAVGGTLVVELDTIEGLAAVPAPTLTLGQGVTVSPAAVVATTTADASVVVGQGATAAPVEVRVLAAIPDLGLKRLVVLPTSNILPQIDVIPYHVSDPARSLARFRRPGAKGRNVFILTNGSVTTQQPGNSALISRTIYGGHESPDDLTSTELDALVAAGYSVEVR